MQETTSIKQEVINKSPIVRAFKRKSWTQEKKEIIKLHNVFHLYKQSRENFRKVKIRSSGEIIEYIREYISPSLLATQEHFFIVTLSRSNETIGVHQVSLGGLSGTLVDPKIIFLHVLCAGASAVILIHNHPSGNMKPSDADIRLTKKLKEGAKELEIALLDHLIIDSEMNYFYSFADDGIL
jgi:DNA repair protein RadC